MKNPRRAPAPLVRLAALWAIFAWGCGPAVSEYTVVKSPSGVTIKLERKRQVVLDDSRVALVLQYRTDLSIDDSDALRAEVEEVWRTFQSSAPDP